MEDPVYASMDDDTAKYILELQLQDLGAVVSTQKGKKRLAETPPDLDLALKLHKQELTAKLQCLGDIRLSHSIGRAVIDDGAAMASAQYEEQHAVRDRRMARELAGENPALARQDDREGLLGSALNGPVASFRSLTSWVPLGGFMQDFGVPARTYESAEPVKSNTVVKSIEGASSDSGKKSCVACLDNVSVKDIIKAPCSHEYCKTCLERLYKDALKDESLFPPRCCRRPIPLSVACKVLDPQTILKIDRKTIELATVDRTYCSTSTCQQFILPHFIHGNVSECPDCDTLTCVGCNKNTHQGNCKEAINLPEFLQVATDSGWQRCFKCRSFVELNTGCNHITSALHSANSYSITC